MPVGKIELYDAFGELLYVLAMADGEIQEEEISTLKDILKGHPWSKEIQWSFDYESKWENPVEDLYKKVMNVCYELGPNPEYKFMIEVLEKVAVSNLGVQEQEQEIIDRFKRDLIEEFIKRE